MPALVILGAPRSGTTLLYKTLCLHPEVSFISNWVARFPGHPGLAVLNHLARQSPRLRRRCWFGPDSNAYVYGSGRSVPRRLFPSPVEGEAVFVACGLGVDGRGDSAAGSTGGDTSDLDALCRRLAQRGGGRTFVTKRIAHNLRVAELARALPGARFVEVVRDGRAVAHSLSTVDWWAASTVWWLGATPDEWEAGGGDPWELCARHWLEERRRIQEGLSAVPADGVTRVRYEQLVDDPVGTLTDVADFAGLRPHGRWLSEVRQLAWHRGDEWMTRLPPDARSTVERAQAPALAELGYR